MPPEARAILDRRTKATAKTPGHPLHAKLQLQGKPEELMNGQIDRQMDQ